MILRKQGLLARLMRPLDDGGDLGGDTGVVDRGDDFTPTGDTPAELEAKAPANAPPKTDKAPNLSDDPFKDDEDEAEDDEKAEDDKPKGKKDSRIPLARHKEILAKERTQREALEGQLAQYQQGQQIAQTNEQITAAEDSMLRLEREYSTLLADGEVDKATALMTRIRQMERSIVEAKAEMRTQASEIRARESMRYDMALERIEETFEVLNPDSESYDKELIADVVDLKQVYQNRGMTPTKALQAAVKKLVGTDTAAQKKATEVAPRVAEKDVAAERKKTAVGKAADAVGRTPPSTRDVGLDSDKAGQLTAGEIMKMSQDDFSKLTESQLAKMRGDAI